MYPILDGGQFAMDRLLKNLLNLGFSVSSLSIETHKHKFSIEDFPEDIVQLIEPKSYYINTKVTFWGVLKSLFFSNSYNIKRFMDKGFQEMIKEILLNDNFELVILESAYLLPYVNVIRMNSDAKVILRAHNVEYRIWKQAARREKSSIKCFYYNKLSKDLKKFELYHANLVDGIFCISEQDKDFFRRRHVRVPMTVIPVYMDIIDDFSVDYENNDFFFIGSMSWKPNADAVNWIINHIAPRLAKVLPDSRIHIAGSAMPDSMKERKISNIIFHGKVANVHEFMAKHGTLIVPLKSGSGVRIKILEALCVGIPIISTEKGKEGINLIPKKHFLTANITEEFMYQMKTLNNNTSLKESLGAESKKFIIENYGITKISENIREFIAKI